MPPPGPPRASQSSISTSQPTPIIVPKPKVKYSTVLSPPWSAGLVAARVAIRRRTIDHDAWKRGRRRREAVELPAMNNQPRPSFKSPRFAQPATFMRLPHTDDLAGVDVAIVGVPYDGGTSYRPGARLGPREVRHQSSLIRTYNSFQKVAPFDRLNVADAGDVDPPPVSIEKAYDAIDARIGQIRRIVTGPAYMTFDIDGVDPAFAPGTGTPEVGGLTSHEAIRLVRGLRGLSLVGGDIVEVAPLFDGPGQITAVLAANVMFEFLCALVR